MLLPLAPLCLALLVARADDPPPADRPPGPIDVISALETALADAIAAAEPSVVAVAREKTEDGTTTAVRGRNPLKPLPPELLNPLKADEISFDQASGVVIGDAGQILVAFHSVRQAARLKVRAPGRQSFEAEILAADPRSDLAVIAPRELAGVEPPKLRPIATGDANALRKGNFVVALGNAYSAARDGSASASWGIVANLARRQGFNAGEEQKQLRHFPTLLQLDAKLNLGMSGGAVVNLKGELVGITTNAANPTAFDAQAGYAIPLDDLGRRVIDALKEGREVEYGFLGVYLDENGTSMVTQAFAGTPAGEGGLRGGDLVVAVGGREVDDADSLVLAVNAQPVGRPVEVKVRRADATLTKSVVLAKYPVVGEVIATSRPAPWRGLRVDYASVLTNTPMGLERRGALALGGVAVIEVREGSPAEAANLKPGQLVISVGGQPTRTPDEFQEAVAGREGPVEVLTESGTVTVK